MKLSTRVRYYLELAAVVLLLSSFWLGVAFLVSLWSTHLGWLIASVAILGTLALAAFMRGASDGGNR